MKENLYISDICCISNHRVVKNGNVIFETDKNREFGEFMKETYKFKSISYPKFFKMDSLSKLGFLSAEILFEKEDPTDIAGENTGIVLANSVSSLETDINYQKTIQNPADYFPSPSVFVYTLSNIVIGEICIRHKINSESAFFVTEIPDTDFLHFYVSDLMQKQNLDKVLLGWIDYLENEYISLFCLIKKSAVIEQKPFNADSLKELFNKIEPHSYGRVN